MRIARNRTICVTNEYTEGGHTLIEIEKRICGNPPHLQTIKHIYCDLCGAEVFPGGTKESKAWEYEGDELCWDCLWDVLTMNSISEVE